MKSSFLVISSYFVKTKYCILNDLSYFVAWISVLIYSRKCFEIFMKTEILYLKQFK